MNPKLDNIIIDLSNDKFKEECGVFGIYSNKSLDLASVIMDYMHFNIEVKKVLV